MVKGAGGGGGGGGGGVTGPGRCPQTQMQKANNDVRLVHPCSTSYTCMSQSSSPASTLKIGVKCPVQPCSMDANEALASVEHDWAWHVMLMFSR